ncbi:replication initiation protein, partial [Undibacterium sp. SXout7W]|uniref:replication initiation protein n=1 Tax=Undibacterium sp. SXout7W TaxID=3413049 RepID=UPI003BF06184
MSNLTVRQGNDLIEASYKIASLGEARLIRLLIAQISPSDEDFKTYQISVTDFARVFNLNGRDSSVYDMVEKSAEDLIRRIITIKDGKSWYKTSWLSSAKYVHGSGIVELRFDKDLKPHLLGLKSYFTQYDLEHTVHFKSLYSVRLFEIMQKEAFKSNEQGYFKRSFEYEELREKMGIEKDEYSLFANFKARVIETAQKEINRFSSLS